VEIMMKMEDGFAMDNPDDRNPLSSFFFSVSHCLHEAMQNLKHGGVVVETVVVRIIIFVIKRKCQQEQ
jgi:hypothetical protein